MVRYADDSVVFCETKEDAARAIDTLCTWLRERGLTLATEKTTLTHLTTGFDFLGCHIRHYRAPHTSRSGYKLLITPSKASVQRLRETLRMAWRQLIGANAAAVVRRLNPLIRGWANYFRPVVATATFRALDNWMFNGEQRALDVDAERLVEVLLGDLPLRHEFAKADVGE